MKLKRYIVSDTINPYEMNIINKELIDAENVVMKLGYPNGTAAEQCLLIYALYSNSEVDE